MHFWLDQKFQNVIIDIESELYIVLLFLTVFLNHNNKCNLFFINSFESRKKFKQLVKTVLNLEKNSESYKR